MKKYVFLILISLIFVVQCSDDGAGPSPSPSPNGCNADSIATYWYQEMGDRIQDIEGMEKEEIKNLDFSDIRAGYNTAIVCERNNAIAQLGLSILEVLELDYSEDAWAVIDSIEAWSGSDNPAGLQSPPVDHPNFLGNQFSLLVQVPFAMTLKQVTQFPPNLTVDNIQIIIENTIIPALNKSIEHLYRVELNTDTKLTIQFDDGVITDTYVIDLGEIYFFDASIHALRAAFKMAVSYDMDILGPDGTYAWIDALTELDDDLWCPSHEIVSAGGIDSLKLYYDNNYKEGRMDSIGMRVVHHNLENRTEFLKLKDDGSTMISARDDIFTMIDRLQSSIAFIRGRNNESEDNVIKLSDLTDLDNNLPGENPPNFAASFSSIEDVLSWVETSLLGSDGVSFTENIGPLNTPYTWRMKLIVLLDGSIGDWKELLPYHQWNLPAGPWVEKSLNYINCWNSTYWSGEVIVGDECQWMEFSDIDYFCNYYYDSYVNIDNLIQLLDAPGGNVVDMGTLEFPYFEDYTFGGLFPEMTSHSQWVNLINILTE